MKTTNQYRRRVTILLVLKRMKLLRKRVSACCATLACVWLWGCNNEPHNNNVTTTDSTKGNAVAVPASLSYDVVNEYPHDPAAFTEGLEYHDGFLYESTGNYDRSDMRKTDLKTGKVITSVKLNGRYFGEGLTVLDGKVYQLTYR